MAKVNKFTSEKEWTVKSLSASKSFPYKERKIWDFIRTGRLTVRYYGPKKVMIPHESVLEFLKNYSETKRKNGNK